MTETDKFALFRDLAGLMRKHGPSSFRELAQYLRDPASLGELLSILETAADAAQKTRGTPGSPRKERKPAKASIQKILFTISQSEPEKAKALSELYDAVMAKRVFRTLKELQSFAVENGLRPTAGGSRKKAIIQFVRDLAARPMSELKTILARIPPGEDRSLEGWANVILDKRTPESR